MEKRVLSLLILGVVIPPAQEYQILPDAAVTYKAPMSSSPSSLPQSPQQHQSQPPSLQPQQQTPPQFGPNPPIPTSLGHYMGSTQQIDPCARDEVLVQGGCHQLLMRGPCAPDEYVLLDPADHKGFCAARLCAPDRIFVFSDQLCHDPLDSTMCPPGRHLYQTAYGTPLCQCPDGTYEADDDLDDDVCQPLLGTSISCPPEEVLWFRDFMRSPECLPDPCGGRNLRRGPNDLPFVPSTEDGKCYQLGQMRGVCPSQTWYSLALQTLRGVCVSLEDAGYEVFDDATMSYLTQLYGHLISRETAATPPTLSPAPEPAPTLASYPSTPTQQTPLPSHAHPEQPQMFAGNQASSGGTKVQYEHGRATTSQADTQDSFFSDQQIPRPQKVAEIDIHGQEYTEHEIISQEEPGRGTHHHTDQPAHGEEGSIQDLPGHEESIAHGRESLASLASPTMTADDNVASLQKPPKPAVIQKSTDEMPSEHLRAHSHHITSNLSHSLSSPTYYSLPQKTVSQSSSAFPSPSQQQPAHYVLPNQQHQALFAQSPSSSSPLSFLLTQAFSSNYSNSEHHASHSQAPPNHFSVTPNDPHYTQPSIYYSQPSSTGLYLPQASPALSPRLSIHSPEHITSHSTHLTPASPERQQLSLEALAAHDGKVTLDQHSLHQGSPPSRSPSGHPSASNASGHQNSFSRSATWEPKEREHHSLPSQEHQQRRYHRGRRSTLPHASPGNVIQPLLTACRAGAQRDVNAKCREIVLPANLKGARDLRTAPPVPPRPSCPEGQAYNSKRRCVPINEAINSINASNLGCPASCLPPPFTSLPHAPRRLMFLLFH